MNIVLPIKSEIKNLQTLTMFWNNIDWKNQFELPKAIFDIIDEVQFDMFSIFYDSPPRISYDSLPDAIKIKLNEVKNKFWRYFFSWKDVLYYIEAIWSIRDKIKDSINTYWVFCDIDDTLVVNWHLNDNVVKKLVAYYKKWKHIQLWTAWNINKKCKLLSSLLPEFEKLWLTKEIMNKMKIIALFDKQWKFFWNIVNKYDYERLRPEIVIDDRCYKRFVYQMNCIPKNFINVNDL